MHHHHSILYRLLPISVSFHPHFSPLVPPCTRRFNLELLPGLLATDTAHGDLSSIILLLASRMILEDFHRVGPHALLQVCSPQSGTDLVSDYTLAAVLPDLHRLTGKDDGHDGYEAEDHRDGTEADHQRNSGIKIGRETYAV